MHLKSIFLHPTSIPLKIKRRISQCDLAGLMAEVAGLSPSESRALVEQLGPFREELGRHIDRIDVPDVRIDTRWFTAKDWHMALYCIVRAVQPEIMVETGVASGISSAFILRALRDNQKGRLFSIDLPPIPDQDGNVPGDMNWTLPEGVEPGCAVPPSLRDRWELLIAPAQTALPSLLERLEWVDIFLHDSDHSYEHMTWEYEQAWPHIRRGGLLLSDDVGLNSAMIDFCRRRRHKYNEFQWKMGATRKKL
jgi:predicted O-methyltransferase YrrM